MSLSAVVALSTLAGHSVWAEPGTFTANMTGEVNGVQFTMTGSGTGDTELGVVDGQYDISTLIPNYDLQVMSAFIITGYPDHTLERPGSVNPFNGVSYNYTRTLTFDDGNSMILTANCQRSPTANHITSTFSLSGTANVPDLIGVRPLTETWTFPGPGSVHGVFRMVWDIAGGGTRSAIAETDYVIPSDIPLPPRPEIREINFQAVDTGTHFTRHQTSVLNPPMVVPGLFGWGVIILMLLLLTVGSLYVWRIYKSEPKAA